MSESDLTPGYLNSSQVPPLTERASKIAYEIPGASICSRQAAPIPDRPAPTMSTSTCSSEAAPEAPASVAVIERPVPSAALLLQDRIGRAAGQGRPPGLLPALGGAQSCTYTMRIRGRRPSRRASQ